MNSLNLNEVEQTLRAEDFRRAWPHALARMLQLAQEMVDQADSERSAAQARADDVALAGKRAMASALRVSGDGIQALRAATAEAKAIATGLPEAARAAVQEASEEISTKLADDLARQDRAVDKLTALVAALEAERAASVLDKALELERARQAGRDEMLAEVRAMGKFERLRL